MKKLFNFKRFSIKTKIFFIVLCSIVLVCGFFLLGFSLYTTAHNKVLYKYVAGNLSFSSYTISSNLKDMEKMSDILLSDPIIQDSLTQIINNASPATDSTYSNQINNQLLSNYYTYKDNGVSFITLYNSRFANSTNIVAQNKKDPDIINEALTKAEDAQGSIVWTFGSTPEPDVYLTRQIREIKGMNFTNLGTLLVSVDIDTLIQSVNLPFQNFEESSYILYNGDTPIYSSENLSEDLIEKVLEVPENEYTIINIQNESYFVVSTTIPGYGWHYVNLIPYSSIRDSLGLTSLLVALVILIGLALTIALSNILIASITIHFKTLLLKMEQLSEETTELPDSKYDYSNRADEIGQLHRQFDWMANRIAHLINVNYKNQLLTKEAQIKALEAQINPHFLYNALESINWRAKSQNNTEISQIAESLGILLREMLRNKESLVPFSYELRLIQSYITIQKIRFENRLLFELKEEADLTELLLPPLTIQPLLENAMRYGVEESIDPCHVIVCFKKQDHKAIIEVMNEGSDFEDNLLEKLRNKKLTPRGFGIGLVNIEQRLKLLFGDEAILNLKNKEGYAVATIIIPFTKKEVADEIINRR